MMVTNSIAVSAVVAAFGAATQAYVPTMMGMKEPLQASAANRRQAMNQVGTAFLGAAAILSTSGSSPANAIQECTPGSSNCIQATWRPPVDHSRTDSISDVMQIMNSFSQGGQNGVDSGAVSIAENDLAGSGRMRLAFRSGSGRSFDNNLSANSMSGGKRSFGNNRSGNTRTAGGRSPFDGMMSKKQNVGKSFTDNVSNNRPQSGRFDDNLSASLNGRETSTDNINLEFDGNNYLQVRGASQMDDSGARMMQKTVSNMANALQKKGWNT